MKTDHAEAPHELVAFGPGSPTPSKVLASLHARLLERSPLAKLGESFMARFYYKVLPRRGLIRGAIAYAEGEPAGFVVFTSDPEGFMRRAVGRHFFGLIAALIGSLLRGPGRLGSVFEGLRIMTARSPEAATEAGGEILSIGVLPDFRDPPFVARTGRKIADELLAFALDALGAEGVGAVRAIVDEDNGPARFFYHLRGWTLEREALPGWRYPTVEFVLRLKGGSGGI